MQRQQVVAVAAEKRGNPLYNQLQLEKEDITARLDASFAKRVLLPENDPTQEAEQLRLQQMELALILQAQAVPVSPRDGHVIHMKVLMPVAQQVAQAVMQGQSNTAVFESVIAHLTEHYTLAEQQGAPKEALAEVAGVIKKAGPVLAKLKEVDAQAQQLAAQSQQLDAEDDQQMQIMQGLAQQGGAAQPPVAQPGVPA
jgi:hypothetical protein